MQAPAAVAGRPFALSQRAQGSRRSLQPPLLNSRHVSRGITTSLAPGSLGGLRHDVSCEGAVRRGVSVRTSAADGSSGATADNWSDTNWLQTSLNVAIQNEDFALASKLKKRLSELSGDYNGPTDWFNLGLPTWLVDRAERLGFRVPTEVQRRALPPACAGMDVLVRAGTGSGKTLAFLLPALANIDYVQRDIPQVLVVVPTKELGVQTVMLAWKLFGRNISRSMPGDTANMFSYKGPRGMRVRGLFDREDVDRTKDEGWLDGVTVVVGTPEAFALAIREEAFPLDCVDFLVVDECDVCLRPDPDCSALWRAAATSPRRWQTVAVGATVGEEALAFARSFGLLEDPWMVQFGDPQKLPPAMKHRAVVVRSGGEIPYQKRVLAVLCRVIRSDLQRESGPDEPPPRALIFAPDEASAVAATAPLRSNLWGAHTLSVLLPTGNEPIRALHAFRDNAATLMLCTPAAERGLDLPAVRHVYNMSALTDPTAYLHRSGRAGRIGAVDKALVTTLCEEHEVAALKAMVEKLGGVLEVVDEPPALSVEEVDSDVEAAKRQLEDILALFSEDEKEGGGEGEMGDVIDVGGEEEDGDGGVGGGSTGPPPQLPGGGGANGGQSDKKR